MKIVGVKKVLFVGELRFTSRNGYFSRQEQLIRQLSKIGDLDIINFNAPKIKGKAKGAIDLSIANRLIKNDFIQRMDGLAKLNSEFLVVVSDQVDVKRMNGSIHLLNVWFKAKNDHRTFEDINGRFTLNGNNLQIEGATLAVNQSDLQLNGSFNNIFNYSIISCIINFIARIEEESNLLSTFKDITS